MAQALPTGVATCRAVVQLDGSMSTAVYQTGTEYILSRCAEVLHADTYRLPAPCTPTRRPSTRSAATRGCRARWKPAAAPG